MRFLAYNIGIMDLNPFLRIYDRMLLIWCNTTHGSRNHILINNSTVNCGFDKVAPSFEHNAQSHGFIF